MPRILFKSRFLTIQLGKSEPKVLTHAEIVAELEGLKSEKRKRLAQLEMLKSMPLPEKQAKQLRKLEPEIERVFSRINKRIEQMESAIKVYYTTN